MASNLLVQLEVKIDDMIETLEIMRLQLADLEQKNDVLQTENATLKSRQLQWEQGLSSLLNKLDNVAPISQAEIDEIEELEKETEEVFA